MAVFTKNGSGILQKIEPIEKTIFEETEKNLKNWDKKLETSKIQDFYKWIDVFIIKKYQTNSF